MQGTRLWNQERSRCKEEGKDGDETERRSQEEWKDGDRAERGDCRSKEEGQDGDGAAVEDKKEKNGRMRLVGG